MAAGRAGFSKSLRLLEAAEFERVFAAPRVSADSFFTILMRSNGKGHARLGLAVAKRRIRKATARNRIRRLARESFRLHRQELPAADIVVMAKPAAAAADRSILWESLAKHWRCLIAAAAAS